jgi:prepilin signal peptidase PulO-like enzyme (type II secretory pathway)
MDLAAISPFAAAYLVVIGLMLGSFINLTADRLPRRESLVKPRSHCRACGRQLNVVDLLPVLGYAVRRGRCATCRSPIGVAAPVVELVAGAAMVLAIAWDGVWPGGVLGLALVTIWGVAVTGVSFRFRRA